MSNQKLKMFARAFLQGSIVMRRCVILNERPSITVNLMPASTDIRSKVRAAQARLARAEQARERSNA